MKKFFELPKEVMDNLTDEKMALIVGGADPSANTINRCTGCGCTIADNKHL